MKKSFVIILIITSAFLLSCDPLLNDWFNTETSIRDVNWNRIDGKEISLNINPAQNATDPTISVNNEAVYAAWIEDTNIIVVKRFNGDIRNPFWSDISYNINTLHGPPVSNISLISVNGSLFLGCKGNTDYKVSLFIGSMWEDYGSSTSTISGTASMSIFQGKIFVTYRGNDIYVHTVRCDAPSTWQPVDDIHGAGIGDTGSSSDAPDTTSTSAALYAAYLEATGFMRLKVRAYNGSSWTTVSSGFNYSQTADDDSSDPSVISVNNNIYVCWRKAFNGDTQRRISTWGFQDGKWNRIDGGMDNGIRYYTSQQPLGTVKTGAVNDKLYALWFENSSGAPTDNRLRGKIFNGDTGSPSWTSIDNNMPITYTNDQIISFDTIGYDSKIYVVFTEANAGINQVHVMVGY